MAPQPNWPDGHPARVAGLIGDLRMRAGWSVVEMAWASGLIVATLRGG